MEPELSVTEGLWGPWGLLLFGAGLTHLGRNPSVSERVEESEGSSEGL